MYKRTYQARQQLLVQIFPGLRYNLLGVTKPNGRLKLAKGKLISDTVPILACGNGKQVRYIRIPYWGKIYSLNSEMHHLLEMINRSTLRCLQFLGFPLPCKLLKYSFLLAANKHLLLMISNTNEGIFLFPQLEPWNVKYLSCCLSKTRGVNILCSPILHLLPQSTNLLFIPLQLRKLSSVMKSHRIFMAATIFVTNKLILHLDSHGISSRLAIKLTTLLLCIKVIISNMINSPLEFFRRQQLAPVKVHHNNLSAVTPIRFPWFKQYYSYPDDHSPKKSLYLVDWKFPQLFFLQQFHYKEKITYPKHNPRNERTADLGILISPSLHGYMLQ